MKIGLFGGTFDPIHCGHLDVAHAARQALDLDCVWMIPARVPPHRTPPRASAAHRFAMVGAGGRGGHGPAGLRRGDGVRRALVHGRDARPPRSARDSRPVVVSSSPAPTRSRTSSRGRPIQPLLDRCHFVVVSRPGCAAARCGRPSPRWPAGCSISRAAHPAAPSIFLVDAPTAPVSSTGVRGAIANRGPLEGLLPSRVATYIERHGLYPAAETAG